MSSKKEVKREVRAIRKAVPALDSKRENKRANKKASKKAMKGPAASKYLAMMNPYLMTVADPFCVRGVRIPDMITTPSTTFTLSDKLVLTGGGSDTSFMFVLGGNFTTDNLRSTFTGLIPLPNTGTTACSLTAGQYISSTSSTFTAPTSTLATFFSFSQWKTAVPTIKNLFTGVRLVSCGIAVSYLGAPLSASGQFIAVSMPTETWRALRAVSANTTASAIENLAGASSSPINQFKGAMARYLPTDCQDTEYVEIGADSNLVDPATQDAVAKHCPGVLVIVATGMPVGFSLDISIVANYEGLPRDSSSSFINAETSFSDPIALAHAANCIEKLPPALPTAEPAEVAPPAAGAGSSGTIDMPEGVKARSKTQGDSLTRTQSSPLGMMGEVLNAMPDVVKQGASIAAKAAPLLAAL